MESTIVHGINTEELRSLINEEISKAIKSINNQVKEEEEELWTISDVCEYLRVTRQTLNQYNKRGLLMGSKIGKSVRYMKKDVMDYVNRCKG